MGEVGSGACADFLVGKTGSCSLMGRAKSYSSDGQGHVQEVCLEMAVHKNDFRQLV